MSDDWLRISRGPWRAPARFVTPRSHGTPIIAMDDCEGARVGIFGPVITKVPPADESLRLWDIVVEATRTPSFWELKRTRTEPPEFGDRPGGVPPAVT